MNPYEQLNTLKKQGQYRTLNDTRALPNGRIELDGRVLLNLSSNDYLGLANHPDIQKAMHEALDQYGAGSGSSRYICGNFDLLGQFEKSMAQFLAEQACLLFSTGYMANVGVITSVVQKKDVVFMDRLCHASIVDAVRLSGAKMVPYAHVDLKDLQRKLKRYAGPCQNLIVSESVFSMDGDFPDLNGLVSLAQRHNALLMIDEAHGLGVFGAQGAGLIEQESLQGQVDLRVGTLGKAFGLCGGYVSGKQELVDVILNKARSSIYTTAMPPVVVAGLLQALKLVAEADSQRAQIRSLMALFPQAQSQIVPISVQSLEQGLALSAELQEKGYFVPLMRYPTVKKGQERLRLSLNSELSKEDMQQFCRYVFSFESKI